MEGEIRVSAFKVGICSLLNEKDIDIEKEVFEGVDVEIVQVSYGAEDRFQKGELDGFLGSVDGLIMANTIVDASVASKLKKCKVVARHGQGVDNLDLDACAARGIAVCNMPAFGVDEVSDHAAIFALMLVKRIHTYWLDVREGHWDVEKIPASDIKKLNTATLALAGFGRIGRETARKAKPFFGRIVAFDPCMNLSSAKDLGVESVDSIETLLPQADVLSIHMPLFAGTRHYFDREKFRLMKSCAFVVNTSRGPIIKGDDLYEALSKGWIAGAALDVVEQEPANLNDPLFSLDNVVFTPHSAFRSDRSLPELRRHCAEEVRRVLTGQRPTSKVN